VTVGAGATSHEVLAVEAPSCTPSEDSEEGGAAVTVRAGATSRCASFRRGDVDARPTSGEATDTPLPAHSRFCSVEWLAKMQDGVVVVAVTGGSGTSGCRRACASPSKSSSSLLSSLSPCPFLAGTSTVVRTEEFEGWFPANNEDNRIDGDNGDRASSGDVLRSSHGRGSSVYRDPSGRLRPPEELARVLRSHGIRQRDTVVLYHAGLSVPNTSLELIAAARVAFPMLYAGVADVRLLDGGHAAWVRAGHPVQRDVEESKLAERREGFSCSRGKGGGVCDGVDSNHCGCDDCACDFFSGAEPGVLERGFPGRPWLMASTRDVRDVCDNSCAAVLADVRAWREYVGEGHEYGYMRELGRVHGARWAQWGPDTYTGGDFWDGDGILRPLDELRRMWASNGIDGSKTTIFYCGTGWRSSFALLIGLSLGMNCRNYDGGWLAWAHTDANAASNPCDVGPSESSPSNTPLR
jgi:3-mercaptopyruvate sulfurtransferase SseA